MLYITRWGVFARTCKALARKLWDGSWESRGQARQAKHRTDTKPAGFFRFCVLSIKRGQRTSKEEAEDIARKSYENQTKIDGNRGLDWSWRLLGEALGAIWAPKAVWHRKKEPDDQKITASGFPFWGQFSTFPFLFRCFRRVLFLVSVLMATRTDVSWILISLFDHS